MASRIVAALIAISLISFPGASFPATESDTLRALAGRWEGVTSAGLRFAWTIEEDGRYVSEYRQLLRTVQDPGRISVAPDGSILWRAKSGQAGTLVRSASTLFHGTVTGRKETFTLQLVEARAQQTPRAESGQPISVLGQARAPVVNRIEPTAGAPGITIKIFGSNFYPKGSLVLPSVRPSVIFEASGGLRVPAELALPPMDDELSVITPAIQGVVSIWVEASGGSSPKNTFTYLPPSIASIAPEFGDRGQEVTIVGQNFGTPRLLKVGAWVKFGESLISASRAVSWTDTKIIVRAPSDYGTGTNDDILKDIVGCGSQLGAPSEAVARLIDISLPGCRSLVEDLLQRFQLAIRPDALERDARITVATAAGRSNEYAYTYKVAALRGASGQAMTALPGTVPKTAEMSVKVALLAPLSGPVPTFGVMTRDAALMAIDEWNAKGGVLGKKITAVVEDSQCTRDPAIRAANKVIDQDKVKYIIGEVCSKASIPVSEIANSRRVIQISPTSTNPDVTVGKDGKVKDHIFRACSIDPFQGTAGAKFALDTLKSKNAFIMLDQANDYVRGLAEFFEKAYTAGGGKVVGKETYTAKDTDFSAILAKVAAAKPDVIYLPDYYNVVNVVTKQAKQKGIGTVFLGGDGWDSSDLDLTATEGGYFTNHFSPQDPRPAVQNFVKAFGARYKDDKGHPKVPDAIAALAYDATDLLLSAIGKAGADDPAKVKDALAQIRFDGVTGEITFDANHNPIKPATILTISEGSVRFYSPASPLQVTQRGASQQKVGAGAPSAPGSPVTQPSPEPTKQPREASARADQVKWTSGGRQGCDPNSPWRPGQVAKIGVPYVYVEVTGEVPPGINLADHETAKRILRVGKAVSEEHCPPLRGKVIPPKDWDKTDKGVSDRGVDVFLRRGAENVVGRFRYGDEAVNYLAAYENTAANELEKRAEGERKKVEGEAQARWEREFQARHKVMEWIVSPENRKAFNSNPFAWKGKVVGFPGVFLQMLAERRALFTNHRAQEPAFVVVSDLPPLQFRKEGESGLLAGVVRGVTEASVPLLGRNTVPELSFVGTDDLDLPSGFAGYVWGALPAERILFVTGSWVREVMPGTPAERAGLKAGDIIVSIGGKPVTSPQMLTHEIRMAGPGKTVSLKINRGGAETEIAIRLERRSKS
jgi:branched-chain amino acid transport system substrate-binding protein